MARVQSWYSGLGIGGVTWRASAVQDGWSPERKLFVGVRSDFIIMQQHRKGGWESLIRARFPIR